MDPLADKFLERLMDNYPDGDERLTSEIHTLKRKLVDFNESDDDDLVQELERVEKKSRFEHICDVCGKQFRQKYNINQHRKTHFTTFSCGNCGKSFSRNNTRKTHEKKCTKQTNKKKNFPK